MINRQRVIHMMDGDENLADKLINAFKEDIIRQLPLLNGYFKNDKKIDFSNVVHRIKSQAAYLGLDDISELSQLLERQVDNGQTMKEIEDEYQNLKLKLENIVKDIKATNQ